jgi:hypothetical protein
VPRGRTDRRRERQFTIAPIASPVFSEARHRRRGRRGNNPRLARLALACFVLMRPAMSPRSILLLATLLAPAAASASEFDLSAGGGASVVYSDPCGFPGSPCTTPRTRLAGASAMLRTTWSLRHAISPRLSLRYGAALSGLFMTESNGTGAILTGGGEFGVTLDRWSANVFGGFSAVSVRADQMTANGPTMAFGGDLAVALTPQLSAFARVDLSAAPEGPIGGAFAGLGVTYHL